MKLSDAIKNIDKSSDNDTTIDICELSNALDIMNDVSWSEEFNEQVIGYYLQKWYCTDTDVGVVAYFFNGEFAFLTKQIGRKCPIEFFFANEDIADRLRKFVLSLSGEQEKRAIDLIDLEEEIPDFYSVYFTNELLATQGVYQGRQCTIDEGQYGVDCNQLVNITYQDKTTDRVNVRELQLSYHIKKTN